MRLSHVLWPLASISAILLAGCGPTYKVAEVDGVLLVDGKPGHKVHIQFIPDIDKGNKGPISTADTDADGRFTLQLIEGKSTRSGAVVGWHRVVFSDQQMAESATGAGVPIRFKMDYLSVSTTPVTQEVTAGKQTVEIRLPRAMP